MDSCLAMKADGRLGQDLCTLYVREPGEDAVM